MMGNFVDTARKMVERSTEGELFKDVLCNAAHLFSINPGPWHFYEDGILGFVDDANQESVFGGEAFEGFVSERDENIAALVYTINALWVYLTHCGDYEILDPPTEKGGDE